MPGSHEKLCLEPREVLVWGSERESGDGGGVAAKETRKKRR